MSAESPKFFSKKFVRESSLSLAGLGAVAIFSAAVARCSIGQELPSKSTWEIIREMQADPSVYPQFNRTFSLQKFMPENPEVGVCKYFDPWEFWDKVVPDPQDSEKLILIKCAPQHGRFP